MKYHVLQDFMTSTPFEEESSDHFKDLHKMERLTNFDISLTSFPGGVMPIHLLLIRITRL